ncbi:MAG: hypothetical protein GY870_07715 [archaeon]|nr:hypothetical protein [archaeon]
MKETEILKLDKRGRIVIPRIMRKSLALTENTQLMAISDSDKMEIRIIPLQLYDDKVFIKMKIRLVDEPGSLARIASTFANLGLSLVYTETVIIKRGVEAEWTVISPQPDMSLDELKTILKEEGNAIDVHILEGKFQIDGNEN